VGGVSGLVSGWLSGWSGVQDTADLSKGQQNNKRKSDAHTHTGKNEKPCGPLARQNKSPDIKSGECKRDGRRARRRKRGQAEAAKLTKKERDAASANRNKKLNEIFL